MSDLLPPQAPAHRLRPLFAIGVHDIPFLQENYNAMKHQASSDLPDGSDDDAVDGWIACTTDSILAMKDTLWDMLITMPTSHASPEGSSPAPGRDKVWPQVECPAGVAVKATQRDLRRFRALKLGLARMSGTASPPTTPRTASSMYMSSAEAHWGTVGVPPDIIEEIVEPTTWAELAYNGFMWWASAGEQARSDQADESAHDNALLLDLVRSQPGPHPHPTAPTFAAAALAPDAAPTPATNTSTAMTTARPPLRPDLSTSPSTMVDSVSSLTARRLSTEVHGETEEEEAAQELAIIAYFHRLTASMLRILADLNDAAAMEELGDTEQHEDSTIGDRGDEEDVLLLPEVDDEGGGNRAVRPRSRRGGDEDFFEEARVRVDREAMATMGLDLWSRRDADFVGDVVGRYFGREAVVEGKGIEVCGIRLC